VRLLSYCLVRVILAAKCTLAAVFIKLARVANSEMQMQPHCYRETLVFLIARYTCSPTVIVRHWCS